MQYSSNSNIEIDEFTRNILQNMNRVMTQGMEIPIPPQMPPTPTPAFQPVNLMPFVEIERETDFVYELDRYNRTIKAGTIDIIDDGKTQIQARKKRPKILADGCFRVDSVENRYAADGTLRKIINLSVECPDGTTNLISVDDKLLFERPQDVVKTLSEAGIIFKPFANLKRIMRWIIAKEAEKNHAVSCIHECVYTDEASIIRYPDSSEEEIVSDGEFIKAVGITKESDGTFNVNWQFFVSIAISILASVSHLFQHRRFPAIILSQLTNTEMQALAELIGSSGVWRLSRETMADLPDRPVVINIDGASDYIIDRAIATAPDSRSTMILFATTQPFTMPIEDVAAKCIVLPLRGSFPGASAKKIRCKIAEILARKKGLLRDLNTAETEEDVTCFENFQRGFFAALKTIMKVILDVGVENSIITDIVEMITNFIFNIENSVGFSAVQILLDACRSPLYRMLDKKRATREDVNARTILFSKDYLYLSRLNISRIAQNNGIENFSVLLQQAEAEGLFEGGKNRGRQSSVRIGNGAPLSMYMISAKRLFPFGQLRFDVDEFESRKPKTIPIGYCGKKEVFTYFEHSTGVENRHMKVTGPSRSGKSIFGAHYALSYAGAGFCVISLGTRDSLLKVPGIQLLDTTEEIDLDYYTPNGLRSMFSDVVEFDIEDDEILSLYENDETFFTSLSALCEYILKDWNYDAQAEKLCDKLLKANQKSCNSFSLASFYQPGEITGIVVDADDEQQNRVLDSLWAAKEICPSIRALIIIDEAYVFDMNPRSPLIRKFLRQGAKRGFDLCLISQYFNARDLPNVTDVKEQFAIQVTFDRTQRGLSMLGLSASDDYVAAGLDDMHDYDFLVSGAICTKNSTIDYPLKCRIPQM